MLPVAAWNPSPGVWWTWRKSSLAAHWPCGEGRRHKLWYIRHLYDYLVKLYNHIISYIYIIIYTYSYIYIYIHTPTIYIYVAMYMYIYTQCTIVWIHDSSCRCNQEITGRWVGQDDRPEIQTGHGRHRPGAWWVACKKRGFIWFYSIYIYVNMGYGSYIYISI